MKKLGVTARWARLGFVLILMLCSAGVCGATPAELSGVRVFQLQDRQVVAVTLKSQLPGEGIDNVLGYRLVPEYVEMRSANRLKITLSNVLPTLVGMPENSRLKLEQQAAQRAVFSVSGPEAAQATVTTVQRKTVKGEDGQIHLRTYLVVNIPRDRGQNISTLVLDAGHGGEDDGAVKNFIREKDINLDITLRLGRIFTAKGWNVVLTRQTDVEPSLLERADAANIVGADLFISVHNNSLPEEKLPYSREYGTTVLYNSSALQPAKELAEIAQDEIIAALGTQREVLQDRPRLVVLNSTWVPAILTEGVMLPHPGNAKLILDRLQRQRMAEAIAAAVEKWRGKAAISTEVSSTQKIVGDKPLPTAFPAGTSNVPANAANHGKLAYGAGWIYYLSRAESLAGLKEETLWRFRPDRFMSDQLVADVEAWDLNFSGDWLYYADWSDGQSIYRARPDGTDATRLVDGPAQQVNLAGDRMIFVKDRQIYSVPVQGGMSILLADDAAENVMVSGEWIYYANGSDQFRPYRMKLDGTRRMKLSDDETLFLALAGDSLFYSNLSDGEKLYRLKLDGSGRAAVAGDRTGYVNTDGRYLYYTNTSDGNALYRIKPDGSARSKIAAGGAPAGPIGIAGGEIFYRGAFYDLKP